MILTGKKTVLRPIMPEDGQYFSSLIEDKDSMIVGKPLSFSQETVGWLALTKEGKASKNIGFVCFFPITDFSVNLQVLIDKQFSNGLDKKVAENKYTFVEDAIKSAVSGVLESNGTVRIELAVFPNDIMNISLLKKAGFIIEGKLRKCYKDNGEYKDILIMAVIKEKGD